MSGSAEKFPGFRFGPQYQDAILLYDEGSLMGEPPAVIKAAEAAGVIYHCTVEDGSCGQGVHTSSSGSGFWHYCEGKTEADYDKAVEGL